MQSDWTSIVHKSVGHGRRNEGNRHWVRNMPCILSDGVENPASICSLVPPRQTPDDDVWVRNGISLLHLRTYMQYSSVEIHASDSLLQHWPFVAIYRVPFEPLETLYFVLRFFALIPDTMIPIIRSNRITSHHREPS